MIIAFALTNHLPAPHPVVASLFNAITNLAYGYSASFIFYYLNIHLPTQKETKRSGWIIGTLLYSIEKSTAESYNSICQLEDNEKGGMLSCGKYSDHQNEKLLEMIFSLIDHRGINAIFKRFMHNAFCQANEANAVALVRRQQYHSTCKKIERIMSQMKHGEWATAPLAIEIVKTYDDQVSYSPLPQLVDPMTNTSHCNI